MTNWLRGLRCYNEVRKCSREIFKCGAQQSSMPNKHQDDVFMDFQKISLNSLQQRQGYTDATSLWRDSLESANVYLPETTSLVRTTLWRFKLPNCFVADSTRPKTFSMTTLRQYGQGAKNDSDLSRDLLVKLWLLDNKTSKIKGKRRRKTVKYADHGDALLNDQYSIQVPFVRWFSDASTAIKKSYEDIKPTFEQPTANQPVTGTLESTSLDEAQVAPLLARSTLLITRDIEWANLVLGFEQENRYAVVDVCYPQSPVGFIREQSNVIARQLLRLRRPFVAYFTDALNNELFRVRRPFWWITSSIYAEINGKEVGVVHRRWHLWRRIYDLYIGNKQFAVVENPGLWNWTFTLKDIDGNVLAQIDRDWRGFGFEIFTDAGQYVIRFGRADYSSGAAKMIQDLEVIRPLTLSERAVTLALAVSLDNDYFSRHGGWGLPFIAVDD